MKEKKGISSIFAVILTLIIVIFGIIIIYLIKNPKVVEITKNIELSTDEKYKTYLTGLKTSLKKLENSLSVPESDEKMDSVIISSISLDDSNQVIKYMTLKPNGDMYVTLNFDSNLAKKYGEEYKIKENIVKMGSTEIGQDTNNIVWAIDENGNVWYIFSSVYSINEQLELKQATGLKNIVDIESNATDSIVPIAVDIEGNRLDYNW